MYFLLLSSKPYERVIVKASTILIILLKTVSLARTGLTPAMILVKRKLFIVGEKRRDKTLLQKVATYIHFFAKCKGFFFGSFSYKPVVSNFASVKKFKSTEILCPNCNANAVPPTKLKEFKG
jgi:hypothetical protein